MRISYGSSYVCSSDLVAHRLDLDDVARDGDLEGLLVAAPAGYRQIGDHRPTHLVHRVVQRHSEDRFAVDVGDVVARLHAGTMGRGIVHCRDKIGRASCRERVCRTVKIPVGDVTLKTKKTK